MKDEYDFSKGEREKFYKENANFHLPIYLDSKLEDFISKQKAFYANFFRVNRADFTRNF